MFELTCYILRRDDGAIFRNAYGLPLMFRTKGQATEESAWLKEQGFKDVTLEKVRVEVTPFRK